MSENFNYPYMPNRFSPVRRKTVRVQVGEAVIGGESPVLVQSMTTTKPKDVAETVRQTLALAQAGCGLVRITVPTLADAQALEEVMRQIRAVGFPSLQISTSSRRPHSKPSSGSKKCASIRAILSIRELPLWKSRRKKILKKAKKKSSRPLRRLSGRPESADG